jgi:Fic family protein
LAEKVHYEAPPADQITAQMSYFLHWFNTVEEPDALIKAGLAHLWFVTIHPFDDGNGRIARAVGDMALARADQSPQRFYSLSAQIQRERKDYYGAVMHHHANDPYLFYSSHCIQWETVPHANQIDAFL